MSSWPLRSETKISDLAVGRPGEAVVVGGVVGQPRGLAARDRHQEQFAVDDEGDVAFVGEQGDTRSCRG